MAISTKLMMRQGQALVMTPQLLQAIKLLQFSNLELSAFLQDELERNPLLEAQEGQEGESGDPREASGADSESDAYGGEPQEGDWAQESFAIDAATLSADLGADMSNAFQPDGPQVDPQAPREAAEGAGLSATSWTGAAGGGGVDGEAPNLEAYIAARPSLQEHLVEQLALVFPDPRRRFIGQAIIDGIDESGYLREDIGDLAARLEADPAEAEMVLATIQSFDPSGVGARDLAECLAIQLRERDRYDPAMQIFVANLPLVAKRDVAQLSRLCGVDEEDIADMAAELRRLDPKPGRVFGGAPVQSIVADVIVRPAADGSWHIELNSDALPRILVNHSYAAQVNAATARDGDKTFISSCLQNANWLTKSLEQRSRTILKVASEIVRLQDAFLAKGVEHLRPLNLRTIADAIGMHESTVSRVTSNKYMMTPRGIFELKYFFSASIATTSGAEAHSAEAVRFRIKQMIDRESADNILSDDAIVAKLKAIDIDIARRTVAKYRDSLRIPSSVDRRRAKIAMAREHAH